MKPVVTICKSLMKNARRTTWSNSLHEPSVANYDVIHSSTLDSYELFSGT